MWSAIPYIDNCTCDACNVILYMSLGFLLGLKLDSNPLSFFFFERLEKNSDTSLRLWESARNFWIEWHRNLRLDILVV